MKFFAENIYKLHKRLQKQKCKACSRKMNVPLFSYVYKELANFLWFSYKC
jgi:hypothetical protein